MSSAVSHRSEVLYRPVKSTYETEDTAFNKE